MSETFDIRFSFLIGSDCFIKDSRAYPQPSGWFHKTNLICLKGCVKNKLLPSLEKKLFLQSRSMSFRGWDLEIFCGFARSNIKTSPQLLCTSSTRKVIHTSEAVRLWKIHDETFWRKENCANYFKNTRKGMSRIQYIECLKGVVFSLRYVVKLNEGRHSISQCWRLMLSRLSALYSHGKFFMLKATSVAY